ncbi:hypothetical protein ACSQ67_010269 [Phaseolus vulgaris]
MLNYLSLTHTLSLKSWHYIESDTSGIQWTLLDKEKAVKNLSSDQAMKFLFQCPCCSCFCFMKPKQGKAKVKEAKKEVKETKVEQKVEEKKD